jgi:hypothetical protein
MARAAVRSRWSWLGQLDPLTARAQEVHRGQVERVEGAHGGGRSPVRAVALQLMEDSRTYSLSLFLRTFSPTARMDSK